MDNEHHRWNRQRAEHCLFFKGGMMDERLPKWIYILFLVFAGFSVGTGLYFVLPFIWHMIIGLGFCVVLAYLWISIIL